MMVQEPKLLTEAEARNLYNCMADATDLVEVLRERGLIAPEPVDEITVELCNAMNASVYRLEHFMQDEAENLREELRSRGIEIGRAERAALTREMVEALEAVLREFNHEDRTTEQTDALYAASTAIAKMMKGEG
jgi:hypothetical protein